MSELRDIAKRLDDIADYVEGLELSQDRLREAYGRTYVNNMLRLNDQIDKLRADYERVRDERVELIFRITKLEGSIQTFLLNPDRKGGGERMAILEWALDEPRP